MNLWRRLVRFLAVKEIVALNCQWIEAMAEQTVMAEKAAAIMQSQADHAAKLVAQVELLKSQAFAEGQCAGRQEMHQRIELIVAARTHGTGDYVSPEDLAEAKKGLLH